MTKSRNIIREKTFNFALSIVEVSKKLQKKNEFVLSRQLLRSGTSIGANVREAQNAISRKEFIHKMQISQKECDETIYWLELLFRAEWIPQETHSKLRNDANEILRILKSIIITSKKSIIHNS